MEYLKTNSGYVKALRWFPENYLQNLIGYSTSQKKLKMSNDKWYHFAITPCGNSLTSLRSTTV